MTNKYNNKWQLCRLSIKQNKDVDAKLKMLNDFIFDNKNKANYERCMNWLKMTKIAYPSDKIKNKFDELIKKLEDNKSKFKSLNDPDISINDIKDDDLKKLYKDISSRKNVFQHDGKRPKDEVKYLADIKKELEKRKIKS